MTTSSGNVNYAGSVDSSPRYRHTDSFDEPTYAAGKGGKLRLMCSYGGYIFPRPHDKSLCYVGGDTRIFVADRNISLAELSARLSNTLIGGRTFCLKYQLQNEDLDCLVNVNSDEDLQNMIDEYDRVSKVSRLRLFLFPSKNESSMKPIDWFVNILNRANSTKVFSESSSVNCLLGLEDDVDTSQLEVIKNNVKGQDVQSVPDSPMVGTTSSFGSTSSMPSLAPIRVHVEQKKHEEGVSMSLSMPLAPETVVSGVPVVVTDDDRKPSQQFQSKPAAIPSDLPSPDSVSSEGSVRQRQYFYQEPGFQIQSGGGRVLGNSVSDSSGRAQVKQQQVQEGGYALPVQYDQHQQMLQPHQYVHHTGGQYIHHAPSLPVPMASYYPIYPSQHQTHHQQHPSLEHQYPVYFVPARSAQGYSSPLQQTHYSEPTQTVSSTHPQTPPPPTAAYNHARNPQASKPEMVAGAYSSAAVSAPQLVQISSGQHQPQYVAYSQIHHPSQSIAPTATSTANYAYDPTHAKMYYTQALAPQFSAQFQTMTSASAVTFPETTSSQHPIENLKHQIRTSQT